MYMKNFARLEKLQPGDKVAILSPSFAAPGMFPHVYELGLSRLREVFKLEPIEYPTTRKLGASGEERAADLVAAFSDPTIKAVIASIGGNDQVTYIKNLPNGPVVSNPKPFFGYSDNTNFANFLWLNGIPSYYGGSLFTQYAMQHHMDEYTVEYIHHALFDDGEFEILASEEFNEQGLDWNDPTTLNTRRMYTPNEGHIWSNTASAEGTTWGGCVESIDELLRHGITIPSLEEFGNVILMLETSEEMPSAEMVRRVFRALGERGILAKVQGVLMGRPKAWEFNNQLTEMERENFRSSQQAVITETVRKYNAIIPIVFNLNFGHTDPQVPMPYGRKVKIDGVNRKITAEF